MTESPFKSQGLVRDLAEYILKRSDTNPSFAETCASALVATACGPNVIITDMKGDVQFNIFAIVIGGSGISNKTVALDIVRKILKKLSDKVDIDLDQPQKFTIEGLSKHLQSNREGLIAGDEYTAIFQNVARTYMKTTMEFLSTLYDGWIPKYGTIGRGIEYVTDVCVGFISATTFYFLKLMKGDDFFLQGTGCRFLWDVDFERTEFKMTPIEAADFFLDTQRRHDRDIELNHYVDELVRLRNAVDNLSGAAIDQVSVLNLDFDALAIIAKYLAEKTNQAREIFNKDLLDPDSGYVARLAHNALKLAGIHCMGRVYDDQQTVAFGDIVINKQDVEWAISKVEHHHQMYLKMREIRDQIQESYPTRGHKSDFSRVLTCIERRGGQATKTQVMQFTGWLKDPTQEILDAMLATKLLKMTTRMEGPGRRNTIYLRGPEGG